MPLQAPNDPRLTQAGQLARHAGRACAAHRYAAPGLRRRQLPPLFPPRRAPALRAKLGDTLIAMDAPPARKTCRPSSMSPGCSRSRRDGAADRGAGRANTASCCCPTWAPPPTCSGSTSTTRTSLYLGRGRRADQVPGAQPAGRAARIRPRLLLRELKLFPEWYIGKHLRRDAGRRAAGRSCDKVFDALLANMPGAAAGLSCTATTIRAT